MSQAVFQSNIVHFQSVSLSGALILRPVRLIVVVVLLLAASGGLALCGACVGLAHGLRDCEGVIICVGELGRTTRLELWGRCTLLPLVFRGVPIISDDSLRSGRGVLGIGETAPRDCGETLVFTGGDTRGVAGRAVFCAQGGLLK